MIAILLPLVPVLYLAIVTPGLAIADVRTHRLPNRLVVPGIAIGAASLAVQWWLTERMPTVPLVGALCYGGFLLCLNLLGGMGMGDVKLSLALGLASWNPTVAVLSPVSAFMAGGVVSLVLILARRRGRLAFGPFLLGGFWCAIVVDALSQS